MCNIDFWYPARLEPDDEQPVSRSGSIKIINARKEPYELIISSNGYSFHTILGSHANGNFLCIPDWDFGCELGSFNDRFWNLSSIARSGQLDYPDACAIANALALIDFLLGKDIQG